MTHPAISINNLSKTYKASGRYPEKKALDDVSLEIPRGSLFALLGPNGAGKSTIINIMAGLVVKTSGSVKIWDINIDENARNSRAAIGIVPQELNLDAFFTPRELLEIQAGLYGVPKAERRTEELLAAVGLTDKANAYARTLSGGMRRRLMVAKAMVHNPPVLVLDEPTAGVDVELRQSLWAYVRQLNKEGVTVLLTTHYLEEAEELCDTIAIINHGKVVACEPKKKLMTRLDCKELRVTFARPVAFIPESLLVFSPQQPAPDQLSFSYAPSKTAVGQMLAAIQSAGLEIRDLSTVESDLEDIFIQITRKVA